MKAYNRPQLHAYGVVEDLTRASFNNSASDSIYFNGTLVGHATGSLDSTKW